MATEEELFIKLLNNEEADKVLKMLNENVKSNNINLKRMRLKKIFRTGSANMTKKKINPFNFVLEKCSRSMFKKFNDMELFKVFAEDVEGKIPNYIKLANALYYYPDETREKLQQIESNYENSKVLFGNIVKFKSNEEVENFFLANNMCSNEIKNNAIEHILERLDRDEKLILKNISEFIENWTLIDYESKFDEYSKKYPVYLIQLQYLKKHKNKVEIENGIALDMIFNYYNLRKQNLEEYNENQSKEVSNLSKEIEKKYKESISENNQLKNKIKELTNKNAKNEKNFLKKNKKYELMESEVRQLKLNLNDALLDSKNNNLKYKKIEKENLYLKLKNQELEEQSREINNYLEYKYLHNKNEDIHYKFSIINSSNTKLVEKIFPEVLFIKANELNHDTLKKISRYTDNIYIQRSGVLSSKINYIESWAKENDINTKIIMPTNEKEMIEEIVKIKIYNFGGDYNAN